MYHLNGHSFLSSDLPDGCCDDKQSVQFNMNYHQSVESGTGSWEGCGSAPESKGIEPSFMCKYLPTPIVESFLFLFAALGWYSPVQCGEGSGPSANLQ